MTSFKDDIVGDIAHTLLSVKFELRKHLRRRRLLIALALAISMPLIAYAIPIISNTALPDRATAFAASNLGYINFLIVIAGAIFAGDVISSEFEKKTGLLLLPTPQRRTSIFVGKYIAAFIATLLVVSLYYLVTVLEITQIYGVGVISMELAKSYLVALIYTTSALSVICFFSSVLKRTITSTLVGFFLLLMILPLVGSVLAGVNVEPWFLVTYSAGLIMSVLGVPASIRGPGDMPSASFQLDFYVGIAVMMAYAMVLFIISLVIFNRKTVE